MVRYATGTATEIQTRRDSNPVLTSASQQGVMFAKLWLQSFDVITLKLVPDHTLPTLHPSSTFCDGRNHLTSNLCICLSKIKPWMAFNLFLINTYTARPVCWSGWISDSYCSLKPLCSGMGEVVPARTSPTLLPPSPRTVLSLSCFKVSQCINCREWHCKS